MKNKSKMIVLLIAIHAALAYVNGPCSSGTGVCVSSTSCSNSGGTYVSGKCPYDSNDIKCCNKNCNVNGKSGQCLFKSQCSGSTYSGLCPGGNDFVCCIGGNNPEPTPTPTPTPSGIDLEAGCKFIVGFAKPYSQGICATAVNYAIEKAGFNYPYNSRAGSAYHLHSYGILSKLGFHEIPRGTPKNGDIYVQMNSDAHPHGHTAMWCYSNWYSDFKQNSDVVYNPDVGQKHYYRYYG